VQAAGRVDPFRLQAATQRVASITRVRAKALEHCAAIAERLRAELAGHDKQLAYFDDRSPQSAALCTRQAGKTRVFVADLLHTSLTTLGGYSIYVRTSKDEIRNNIWDNEDDVGLLSTIRRLSIPCETSESRLSVLVPATGSRIKLIGIDDVPEVRKLRGPTYDLVEFDEVQDIPYLKRMLDAVRAGTVKRRGRIRLGGTPGQVADGEFFDITRQDGGRKPGWSVHEFTIYDNPGIPHAAEYVEDEKRRNGWTDDDESFQREFKGRWVTASRLLVYRLSSVPREKRYHSMPTDAEGRFVGPEDWRYLIGVDLGFYPDPFAVVVWAYCDERPQLFEVESGSYESLNTEQQAGILAALVEKYNPERVVCDAGSGGLKQIVVGDWQQRYGLPVDVAQKEHKDSAIDMFNADLVANRILMREGSALDRQMTTLPWKDQIGARRVEDVRRNKGRFHNDVCFAAGTPVKVPGGERAIEEVRPGDVVWTRAGLRRAYNAAWTGRAATFRLETDDGRVVVATGDHRFMTPAGWRCLQALMPGDMLVAWADESTSTDHRRPSSIEASPTGATQSHRYSRIVGTSARTMGDRYTVKSGRTIAARSRMGITFITSMAMRATMRSRTSLACLVQNICARIGKRTQDVAASLVGIYGRLALLPPNGMALQRASSSIAGSVGRAGNGGSPWSVPASSAARYSIRLWPPPTFAAPPVTRSDVAIAASTTSSSSAPSAAKPTGGTDTPSPAVALVRVLRVEPTGRVENVYNLSVEDVHEYFAGGLVVANCDAGLYAYRESPFYEGKPRAVQPPYGSPAYEEAAFDAHKSRLITRLDNEDAEVLSLGDLDIGGLRSWNR
jgi:Hint domain-containing protein/terminase large subunit-like protein